MPPSDRPPRRPPPAPRLQDKVRLSADGIAKVLGDLEARVLRAVWAFDHPVPARQVHESVIEEHDVHVLTVVTVLNKLVAKGILARRKRGGLLHYEARWSEEAFMAHASRWVVEGVLALGVEAVTASFVDVLAERDPARLDELNALVRARLADAGANRRRGR